MNARCLLAAVFFTIIASGSAQESRSSSWGGASWVWDEPNANAAVQSNEPLFFRQRFDLTDEALKAELWITADNAYVTHVNGKKVGGDETWQSLDKYDVAKLLAKGANVLAIEAKNQGGVAGLIARLWVETADKKETLIVTGTSTKTSRTGGAGWTEANFDDAKWQAASVLGDVGIGPWNLVGGGVAQTGKPGKGKPGKSPQSGDVTSDGKIKERLSAQEEHKHFTVPKGFSIELVIEEPLLINPVTLAVDDRGRMLVSESHTYRYGPGGSPVKPYKNPVVRFDPIPGEKGFARTVIADGFDDPAMGIAVKGDKLWIAANNYLYQYDYPAAGPATNKKTLVVDKNKAWNPFGMFVLEIGPDDLLYLSVGNHAISLEGPTNKVTSRGGSGIVVRMNPDGSNMETLVQGLRVPYSFEFDPFGQLWLLSNGEGNPNRFVKVIQGVDYHCYSRPRVDNNWLAGNHPLAPPSFELLRGAHTQLMRYYGAAYPPEYQGSLLLDNWGAHGFHGPNRAVFRYHPDERGRIALKEPFVSCNDPHFRPAHIALDPDGNLLIADWYGRDDESDLTGRIWRVRYDGTVARPAPLAATAGEKEMLAALGSTSHVDRDKAMALLVGKGNVAALREHAASAKNALGAANALWCLTRIKNEPAYEALLAGTQHADPRVRRLALDLGRRFQGASDPPSPLAKRLGETAQTMLKDADPAVRLEAAVTLGTAQALADLLLQGDADGAPPAALASITKDQHLRYQAAAALARSAGPEQLTALLKHADADVRLAGLIAIDVACWENYAGKKAALLVLAQALTHAPADDIGHVLFLIQQHGDAAVLPALEKLILRDDISAAVGGKAMLVYRGLAGKLPPVAGKRFLEGVQKGVIPLTSPADQLALLEFLEAEGPTPFALEQLNKAVRGNNPQVKPAALALARKFGPKSGAVVDALWPVVHNTNPKAKAEETLDALATIAVIQSPAQAEPWTKLLTHAEPLVRTDAVRWFRTFKGQPSLVKSLVDQSAELVKADPELGDDLATVLRELGASSPAIAQDDGKRDKAELAKLAGLALSKSPAERQKHALLGKQVFERALCTKCHTTVMQNTPLAPSLKGIAAQKLDYLVESILEPSKIIKTGFESEVIVTTAGKTLTGLVKDEGTHLRVQNAGVDVRVLKADVDQRTLQKQSIMPAGQETQLSRREFVDLIAYLSTLK